MKHLLLLILLSSLSAWGQLDFKGLQKMEKQVQALVASGTPATVALVGRSGTGSGVIIDKKGTILTAAHVMQGSEEMTVIFADGKRAKAKTLGMDSRRDIGMVKITDGGEYPHVPIGDSDKIDVTTIVIALGHPGGFDIRRSPPIRIGRAYNEGTSQFIVSDCTLIGGDSGGPLFNLAGEVIGIHSSIGESLLQNNHAPVNVAVKNWDRLLNSETWGGEDDKPVLGVQLDRSGEGGVKVDKVYPESPALSAGVKVGDVIVEFGERPVRSYPEMMGLIGRKEPGDTVSMKVQRDDQMKELSVTLGRRGDFYKDGVPEAEPDADPAEKPEPPAKKAEAAKAPGFLGIVFQTDSGALLANRIVPGSAAAKAGMQTGDKLLEVNDQAYSELPALALSLQKMFAGDEIKLTFLRDGSEKTATTTLGKRP